MQKQFVVSVYKCLSLNFGTVASNITWDGTILDQKACIISTDPAEKEQKWIAVRRFTSIKFSWNTFYCGRAELSQHVFPKHQLYSRSLFSHKVTNLSYMTEKERSYASIIMLYPELWRLTFTKPKNLNINTNTNKVSLQKYILLCHS